MHFFEQKESNILFLIQFSCEYSNPLRLFENIIGSFKSLCPIMDLYQEVTHICGPKWKQFEEEFFFSVSTPSFPCLLSPVLKC